MKPPLRILDRAKLRVELREMVRNAKVVREPPAMLACGWQPKPREPGILARVWRWIRGR